MVYQDTQESPKNPGPAGGETVLRRWFVGGKPVDCPADARIQDDATFSAADVDHMVMNLVPLPSPELVGEFADVWQLHPVLRKELLEGVPLPKLDEYGDDVFIALRSAWYNEGSHDVEFAQFHVVLRKRAILVFAYDGKWIDGTPAERVDYDLTDRFHNRKRESLFEDEHLLSNGPGAVLYRFLESVVKGYEPVMRNLSIDKEEIERQVLEGNAEVAERIYRLSEEVIELQHASGALLDVVTELSSVGITRGVDDDMREYLQEAGSTAAHVSARNRLSRRARPGARGERHTGRAAAKREHAEDLGLGRDHRRPDDRRRRLRYELRQYARAGLALRVSLRHRVDVRDRPGDLDHLQDSQVDVNQSFRA